MFLFKSWKNNIYLRNSNEMFQKLCGNWLLSSYYNGSTINLVEMVLKGQKTEVRRRKKLLI